MAAMCRRKIRRGKDRKVALLRHHACLPPRGKRRRHRPEQPSSNRLGDCKRIANESPSTSWNRLTPRQVSRSRNACKDGISGYQPTRRVTVIGKPRVLQGICERIPILARPALRVRLRRALRRRAPAPRRKRVGPAEVTKEGVA